MAEDREKVAGKASKPVANSDQLPEVIDIKPMIRVIRGQQVMIDRDLALLYGVETRVLNQAVKRNSERFPDDFMFQLSKEDVGILKSQNVTSSWGGDRRLPYAFTEQGIAMLSSVLKSQTAVDANISPSQSTDQAHFVDDIYFPDSRSRITNMMFLYFSQTQ